MAAFKRLLAATAALAGLCTTAQGTPLFCDPFSNANAYSGGTSSGAYTATDGIGSASSSPQGMWKADGGTLVYSRSPSDPPANGETYNYESSVLLTSGSTPDTGSNAGLTAFTVCGKFNDVSPVNTAQPGLIVSGSLTAGGYLLTEYTNAGGDFVLLAETGTELLRDEGDGASADVVKDFGTPTVGDNYSMSVTEDRSGANPTFDVCILDLGQSSASPSPDPTVFYSGSFADLGNNSQFGGDQIGYRVRDAHDDETPCFGALSLSLPTPEPAAPIALAAVMFILCRPYRDHRRPGELNYLPAVFARCRSAGASESRR